ncbi:hypothetical protein Hanom_Chr11g01063551 [Helianthus anomalus]
MGLQVQKPTLRRPCRAIVSFLYIITADSKGGTIFNCFKHSKGTRNIIQTYFKPRFNIQTYSNDLNIQKVQDHHSNIFKRFEHSKGKQEHHSNIFQTQIQHETQIQHQTHIQTSNPSKIKNIVQKSPNILNPVKSRKNPEKSTFIQTSNPQN